MSSSVARREDWFEDAASALVSSRRSFAMLDRLADEIRPRSVEEGYLVQHVARRALEANGFGRQGGWKVGCTTAVMQAYLGVDSPTAGTMRLSTMRSLHHDFMVAPPRRLGVECEIAVRIGSDLPASGEDYALDEVANAVQAVMTAIEVVEDRYEDYSSLDLPTLVADDFFHFGCVLGEERRDVSVRDLRTVVASMTINGVVVGQGIGTDILGDPLRVLHWLTNHAVRQGEPLRAGDIVLLGSLVQTQWVNRGDEVQVENTPLGRVSASFV